MMLCDSSGIGTATGGYGDGAVVGSGFGSGYGDGFGSGFGDGGGDGAGYGVGFGSGFGFGDGGGDGAGFGYGVGEGYGDGLGLGYGEEVGRCGLYRARLLKPWSLLEIGCEIHTLDEWINNADEIDAKHDGGIADQTRALALRLKDEHQNFGRV